MEKRLQLQLEANFHNHLEQNPYPGRGIIIGVDSLSKHAIQLYFVTGRSENSRNRVLSADGERLFTDAADPTKVNDPSLIIYNAMMGNFSRTGGFWRFVVSNGHHTEDVMRHDRLSSVLAAWRYEPDNPNFTPRITGVCTRYSGAGTEFQLAMIRKSDFNDSCVRLRWDYDKIPAGVGYCLTTYMGDGNPLPAFTGEPLAMPLTGTQEELTQVYWNALNEANRVALAVKFIPLDDGPTRILIENKYLKVGSS